MENMEKPSTGDGRLHRRGNFTDGKNYKTDGIRTPRQSLARHRPSTLTSPGFASRILTLIAQRMGVLHFGAHRLTVAWSRRMS